MAGRGDRHHGTNTVLSMTFQVIQNTIFLIDGRKCCTLNFHFNRFYALSNWTYCIPEKLTVPQLVKNPPHFIQLKDHCRIYNRPPPAPIPGQINRLHPSSSHVFNIRINIILPSTPRSPKWSLSQRSPHKNPVYNFLVSNTCYMSLPFISIWWHE